MAAAKVEELEIKNSSNLKRASYDKGTRDLVVTFGNGTQYRYPKITGPKWNAFKRVIKDSKKSAGSWFNLEIKEKVTGVKVEAAESE